MIDIYWYGQACVKIKGKDTSVVIDPYNSAFTGLKPLKTEADIVCVTHEHEDHNDTGSVKSVGEEAPFVISGPGEYEKKGINIIGVSSFHDDKEGAERGKNTIYSMAVDGVNFVHLGDLGQKKLTQKQIEEVSSCDVLFIPVGGTYTISAEEAPDIISEIEPKIVIPIHYKVDKLKFDLDPVGKFLTAMGKEKVEPVSKLSIARDKIPEEVQITLLAQQ